MKLKVAYDGDKTDFGIVCVGQAIATVSSSHDLLDYIESVSLITENSKAKIR